MPWTIQNLVRLEYLNAQLGFDGGALKFNLIRRASINFPLNPKNPITTVHKN
jgi:hypothetical protein